MSTKRTRTAAERSRQARVAALTLHATRDSRELTAKARAASPASIEYHERAVDPNGTLPVTERRRRAERAMRAYFLRLATKSAAARRAAGVNGGQRKGRTDRGG